MKISHLLAAGATALMMTSAAASADEELDMMLKEALPVMMHSCDTVVEETDGDEEAIYAIVRSMVVVSLVNREIDITEYANTEEEFEVLRAEFIEVLRAGCKADRDALLAGIVDQAVKTVLKL